VRRFLPELIDLVWNGKINPAVARNKNYREQSFESSLRLQRLS
jgi:hypothetical protein